MPSVQILSDLLAQQPSLLGAIPPCWINWRILVESEIKVLSCFILTCLYLGRWANPFDSVIAAIRPFLAHLLRSHMMITGFIIVLNIFIPLLYQLLLLFMHCRAVLCMQTLFLRHRQRFGTFVNHKWLLLLWGIEIYFPIFNTDTLMAVLAFRRERQ